MTDGAAHRPLLVRAKPLRYGNVVEINPDGNDWRFIAFRVVRLAAGERLRADTGANETVLVVIAGSMDVHSSEGHWKNAGGRADPFSGQPVAVYLPPSTSYDVEAAGDVEVAICGAPASARERRPARLIAPHESEEYVRGDDQAKRRIRNILMRDDDASSLFLTEVITLPGNWSSFPPHKHDVDNLPHESALEELYYYRASPRAGFAFQRIYTAKGDLDETVTAHDSDVVLVPRGYHVCAAAAGYWIYYLNVLAGPKHVYRMTFDPNHAWIKEHWTW